MGKYQKLFRIDPDKTRTKLFTLLTFIFLALIYVQGRAHHLSSALYDMASKVSINGVITKVEWKNPHVYLYVEEKSDGGDPITWEIEGPPPATLRRAGWSRGTINIGDQLTVNGKLGRDTDRNLILFDSLVLADNTVISLEGALVALPQQDAVIKERATTIAGTWGTNFNMEVILRLIETSKLELTEKGRSAIENYVEETDNPGIECIPSTAPMVMLVPDIKTVEVGNDMVLIRGEHEAMERKVYLNIDSHEDATDSIHGHSIGHWEGKILVIDTTNFIPHRQGNATGLPSGVGKHLIERLVLNEEGSRVAYSFELEDPEYLAMPVTGEIQWAYRPDFEYVDLPCDLDIARRFAQ